MATILFPDADALRLALTSGAVPPAIAQSPARSGIDAQGRIWIEPAAALPRTVATALAKLGGRVQGTSAIPLPDESPSWPLILPLQPEPAPSSELVLFDVPARDTAGFAAQLRRCGAGKIGCRIEETPANNSPGLLTASRSLLLVERPPQSALLAATERTPNGPRAFLRQSPRVWVEYGYRHPVSEQIVPPAGHVALVTAPRDHCWLDDAPFKTGPSTLMLPPGSPVSADATPNETSLPIDLRLARSHDDEPAELWVVPEPQLPSVFRLAEQCDDRMLARITIAFGRADGEKVAVLRARTGRLPPPVLVLEGALPCRPVLRLPNLFVPCGWKLRPLLRRDVLRAGLAADASLIVWLQPTGSGGFTLQRLADDAFRPLSDIIRYTLPPVQTISIGTARPVLPIAQPIVKELQRAVRPNPPRPKAAPPAAKPAPAPQPASEGWLQKFVRWFTPRVQSQARASVRPPTQEAPSPSPTLEAMASPGRKWERQCRQLEARLLRSDLADADRRALWSELAQLYAANGRQPDAAACWLHSLWLADSDDENEARNWLAAAAEGADADADPVQWLTDSPTPRAASAVAAFVVWAATQESFPLGFAPALSRAQQLLDDFESDLPVRAAWLSRVALFRLTSGDAVGLMRCRDRLFRRLFEHGLSADRDVPAFVRFAGQVSHERREETREWLMRLRPAIHRWIAQPVATPNAHELRLPQYGLGHVPRSNRAYTDLILAWGLSRLGDRAGCDDLLAQAGDTLPANDAVHAFLRSAYQFRARQQLEGPSRIGPLPIHLLDELRELQQREKTDPALRDGARAYKINRLRESSRILEPDEQIDAFEDYLDRSPTSAGALRAMTDRDELEARLTEIVQRPRERLPHALALALDLAPRVGESFATATLDRLLSAADHWRVHGLADEVAAEARALERGWFVAARFAQLEAARRLLIAMSRLLDAHRQIAEKQTAAEESMLALAAQALRSVHRLSSDDLAGPLVERLAAWSPGTIPRNGIVPALRRRLLFASACLSLGREPEATEILDQAAAYLFVGRAAPHLARTYMDALEFAPAPIARARVEELFQRLPGIDDSLTTNSHFSLVRLGVVEAAVLAVVNDDFALTPAVRRWMDDDEFRVRREIQRDVSELTGADPVL